MELQLLETVSLPYEADHLQQALAAAGVEAYVEGLNGSNAFGMNALMGSIKIKVRKEDLSRARAALAELSNPTGTAWYCGKCQEENEANFDICWKCGGERSEVEGERPRPEIAPEATAEPIDYRSAHPSDGTYDPSPYAPPASELVRPAAPETTTPAQAEYEDTIERAYRASILGLVTFPIALHVYSLLLLVIATGLHAQSTRQSRWRFRTALVIDLAALIVVAVFILAIGRR